MWSSDGKEWEVGKVYIQCIIHKCSIMSATLLWVLCSSEQIRRGYLWIKTWPGVELIHFHFPAGTADSCLWQSVSCYLLNPTHPHRGDIFGLMGQISIEDLPKFTQQFPSSHGTTLRGKDWNTWGIAIFSPHAIPLGEFVIFIVLEILPAFRVGR